MALLTRLPQEIRAAVERQDRIRFRGPSLRGLLAACAIRLAVPRQRLVVGAALPRDLTLEEEGVRLVPRVGVAQLRARAGHVSTGIDESAGDDVDPRAAELVPRRAVDAAHLACLGELPARRFEVSDAHKRERAILHQSRSESQGPTRAPPCWRRAIRAAFPTATAPPRARSWHRHSCRDRRRCGTPRPQPELRRRRRRDLPAAKRRTRSRDAWTVCSPSISAAVVVPNAAKLAALSSAESSRSSTSTVLTSEGSIETSVESAAMPSVRLLSRLSIAEPRIFRGLQKAPTTGLEYAEGTSGPLRCATVDCNALTQIVQRLRLVEDSPDER